MEKKVCLFNENEITFIFNDKNQMMINATEMARPFGKRIENFMRNEDTQNFISECLKKENYYLLRVAENSLLENGNYAISRNILKNGEEIDGEIREDDLYISSQKSGTWMNRILALKFAAWLNPTFELWVYSTIEKLMFGKFVERESSLQRTLKLEREKGMLVENPNKTGKEFERYLEIERLLKQEKAIRRNLTSESISEIKGLFD